MGRLTRLTLTACMAALAALSMGPTALPQQAEEAIPEGYIEPVGLGDPGSLVSISVYPGSDLGLVLRGRDARMQLVVTGQYDSGQERDLTRAVSYTVEPSGILEIDASGFARPLTDGTATITATHESGLSAQTAVTITQSGEVIPINFANQIVPIFSKLGCNSGGCHGKSGGQNGFRLSLLGFYPNEDYEYLVMENRGRRLFPAAPERSLLLMKPSGELPHGGGVRMRRGSYEYQLLYNWIEQGMPRGSEDDPVVERIEVFPRERSMDRGADQQIQVFAHYSDGHIEDVTRIAQYEPQDPAMAEAGATGLVSTLDMTGGVAIMARFSGHVDVFRATIPLGAPVEGLPPARNFIDELVFARLQELGIPPSEVCDDATFIRRVYLDITGQLPTAQEVRAFLDEPAADKRDRLIDRLLDSEEYADFFANKWNLVLRNKVINGDQNYRHGNFAFHNWIRNAIYENMPYDEFVRSIIAASGSIEENPPVVWYREVNQINEQVEDTAQLFLGLRIACARCHHHPFERWSQDDYYGFAAFFSRVGRKDDPFYPQEFAIFHNRGAASAQNPRSGQNLPPAGLGSEPLELGPDDDPRVALAEWMADPENPFFAPVLVNRYWKHFFGRGLVEPEDDLRVTNPPSNPELLEALSRHFIDSGFDMKELIRTICRSTTYQLSSTPNPYNEDDEQNFSRFYPRRLGAEVLYDALHRVTNTSQSYNGMPAGTTAIELPDPGLGSYFLRVFGQPQAESACECERSAEANLAQSLHMLNSQEILSKIAAGDGRAALLAADTERSHADRVTELYLWAFAREPDQFELSLILERLETAENARLVYEDIVWALINTKEFQFNH